MAAVRQHYKLATTGKLGQDASSASTPKSTGKKTSEPMPSKKGGGYGGKMKKGGY